MWDRHVCKPQAVEDVACKEAQHSKVEHVSALVSGKQQKHIAQSVEQQGKCHEFLVAPAPCLLVKEADVYHKKKRHQKRLGRSIEARRLLLDGKEADNDD